MYASEIVKRARSLADIPNSQYINREDEINSLWESYKDIYATILDSSDDYYLKRVDIDTSTATKLSEGEWELTIPADVYRIRFVDYNLNGRWFNMNKFNIDARNDTNAIMRYRWRGSKLWINGGSITGLPQSIRLEYYVPPIKPSVPETDIQYATSYPEYQKPLISSPFYINVDDSNDQTVDYLFYIYNGVNIKVESYALNTTTTLYTSTGLSNLYYNAGYIYYLKGGDIYRAITDYASTLAPTMITARADIVRFSISNNTLIYSNGTNTYVSALDGTAETSLFAYDTKDVYYISGVPTYIKVSDGLIYSNTTSLAISATNIATDGTILYYLDTLGFIHSLDGTVDTIIYEDAISLSGECDNRLPIIAENYNVYAISIFEDTSFDYPINETNEIMAYQSAIDYKRKANGDTTLLEQRLAFLRDRFLTVLRRDDNRPERRISETRNNYFY